MRLDPTVTFLIVLAIGIIAGLIFDRLAGPGWLSRQISGGSRVMLTSSLVGIAGSFIGFHVFSLLGIAMGGYGPLLGAVLGAAAVLWLWRAIR